MGKILLNRGSRESRGYRETREGGALRAQIEIKEALLNRAPAKRVRGTSRNASHL